MLRPLLVIVHSPLTPPWTWDRVSNGLARGGWRVATPSLASVLESGGPYYRGSVAAIERSVADAGAVDGFILIAHSGAGGLIPAAAAPACCGIIFIDAILPHPGNSWFDTLPSPLAESLRDRVTDARLPPWTTWFPEALIAALLPDEPLRRRFQADAPRMPVAWADELSPSMVLPDVPTAYLRLSSTYEPEAAEAERRGWLTRREDLAHLAMLTAPAVVCDRIGEIAEAMMSNP